MNAQLRPGADQSRAEAELAAARTQLIQAQQAMDVSRDTLAQFSGADPSRHCGGEPAIWGHCPPNKPPTTLNTAANPVLVEQNAAVEQARAQLRVLERSYFPRFYLQGAAYARGTGAETNGDRLGGLNGLAPNFQNYALGFTVRFRLSICRPCARVKRRRAPRSVRRRRARSRSRWICGRSGTGLWQL